MALLRNNVRSCLRTLRFFSKEAPNITLDPTRLMRGAGRAIPTILIKHGNFTFNKWLENDKLLKAEDWIAAREEFLSCTEFHITEDKVDMIIVNLCLEISKINTAMSYLEYLWDTRGEMNLSSMITYLKLCYVRENQELNDSEKKYLSDIYDTVRTKYPIVDAHTGECCVLAISRTERWRETFELLDIIKLSCKPKSRAYSAIISAAFENNEPEIGWKYLAEVLVRVNPEHRVFITYLEYCKRNFDGEELENAIGKMFEFWGDHDVRPYIDVIDAYEKALIDLGWQADRTSIKDVGICRSCSHRLYDFKISEEEFNKLARIVRERVIVGDDVYQKTTPKELKSFLEFVQRSKPWDIVIDGLNISYIGKSSGKPNGYLVKSAVKMCVEMGKKVLVLGRKHMLRLPMIDMNYINRKAHVFLAENGSADDPYMLYATLCSGTSTMFVSRDLMRQHACLLEDPNISKSFKYWQMTHQLSPHAVMSKSGKIEIKLTNPPKYLPVVQKDNNGWHVPYTFESSLQPPLVYEPPKTWICFRKNRPPTQFQKSSVP